MRLKNLLSTLFVFAILAANTGFAQDTVTVTPGFGSLEAAIEANGGDVVYKLEAGAWYGCQGVIEVNDTTLGGADKELVIIGEETDGLPAIIQVGNAADGSVFPNIFNSYADMTLKNLFLAAQDFDGITGAGTMTINAPVTITMDNCVLDPVGVNYLISGGEPATGADLYFTNNLLLRNGHVQGPNDGGFFMGIKWDTIWIENNTFVSSGQDLISAGGAAFHAFPPINFIWINHNTFFWHDVWLKKTYNDKNVFVANNLFHDVSIFAQLYAWGQFFPDYTPNGNRMLSLTCVDTAYTDDGQGNITNETLPSERVAFWEYNLQYNSPQLKGIPKYAADSGYAGLYLIPLLWNEDTPADYASYTVESPADSSREASIFADKANFPNMYFNNNQYDVDPGYTDPMIYSMNDSMYANVINWYRTVIFQEQGLPPQSEVPSYMWDVDGWAGTPDNEYPVEWPRFDGSYTNSELLTASIEGLPLGDLNWFPEEKAKWMAERSQIEDHIMSLNEEKYMLAGETTVVDIIVDSPDHDTLEAAVVAADLVETLQGEGPFTVFAPTDAAFAALPEGLLDDLLADPSGDLTSILLYHVVAAKAMSTDLSDGQVIETVLGQDITVTISEDGVFINDAQVTVADLEASNGVVHVIDAVIVPELRDIVEIVIESEAHDTLEAAVVAAGLVETLQGEGPFTLFAPTDDAFAALPEGALDDLLADPTGALADVLKYHVVAAKAMSTDLSDGQVITTVLGKDVTVTINDDGVFINDAQVTVADIVAINGVIHVIDAVLLPPTNVENNNAVSLKLYPNPVDNQLIVQYTDIEQIVVRDILGKAVRTIELAGVDQTTINTADLTEGIYFINVKTSSTNITARFVKK